MTNESESKPARRVEDKRADSAVNWSDAPRLNAMGIAQTWSVTVEAEGARVLSVSDDHVYGLDSEALDQFKATIRNCAMHLLSFIGAPPAQFTAPAPVGIAGLTRYGVGSNGEPYAIITGKYYLVADIERLLGAHAPVAAKLTDERIAQIIARIGSQSLNVTRAHEIGGKTTTIMENEGVIEFAHAIEREVLAHAGVGAEELLAIPFDGHAVFQEITSHLGKGHCYSPDAVSATLDAVVRLMRKALATPSPQAQAAVSEQTAAEVRRAALEEAHDEIIRRHVNGNFAYVHRDECAEAVRSLATKEAADAVAPKTPEVPLWDENGEPWNLAAEQVEYERAQKSAQGENGGE